LGSVLSAYLASEGVVDGVVAAGQVVKAPLVSEETIRAVESSKAPEKKKKFVRGILETEPTFEDSMKLSKIVRKYTNAYYGKEQPAGKGIVSDIFHSPDYSFKNKMACFMNYTSKNRDLVMELAKIDLSEALLKSPVPYAVFAGECDIVTPLCPVEEIASKNPNLTAEQVAGAGHFPSDMYMKSVFERLRELI